MCIELVSGLFSQDTGLNETSGQFSLGIDGQFWFWNWNCLFKKMELIKLELKFATKKILIHKW